MCYKAPGPRCSAHALEQMEKAQAQVDRAMTARSQAAAKEALAVATKAYYTTPAGFAALQAKIDAAKASESSNDGYRVYMLEQHLEDCKNARAAQIAELKVAGIPFEEESEVARCADCGQYTGAEGHECSAAQDPYATQADLSGWAPAQVDGKLSEVLAQKYKAWDDRDRYSSYLDQANTHLNPRHRDYRQFDVARWEERKQEYEAKIAEIDAYVSTEVAPRERFYDEEYRRRGGWTRAFIVTNANGHVHKNMECSSCYPKTRYAWLTRFSGTNEDEVVEAAGERACTVCYPSAPVESLSRPTTVFTPAEEQRAVERAEAEQRRAEKAAAAAAKAITTPDGRPLKFGWDTLRTERAAQSAYVDHVASSQIGYARRDITPEEVDLLEASLAAKRDISVEELRESLKKKIAAKARSYR